jgi:hypothetical protein
MMEFRAHKYNADGGIDCEILLPRYGWVPHTVEAGSQLEAEIASVGGTEPHVPEPPSPVTPTVVTKLALKLALGQAAAAKITAAANNPNAGWGMKVRWEDAVEIRRPSALADYIASVLGFDAAAMDALFLAALGETP